ncbi:MAG: hypothetical protein V2I40_06350 [Desulfobacteraceae bacterium]|jgi:hypothetical protein|nr:hypothetical protein [Desulfobacteraceae bacterium]
MRNKCLIVLVALLLSLLPMTALAAMSSASYRITTTVMSGGGGIMGSAGYQLNGTLGQPSPLVDDPLFPPFSANYELLTGFWYTLDAGCQWDIEPASGDGDVDGADLAEFINAFNTADLPSFAEEFGRLGCH